MTPPSKLGQVENWCWLTPQGALGWNLTPPGCQKKQTNLQTIPRKTPVMQENENKRQMHMHIMFCIYNKIENEIFCRGKMDRATLFRPGREKGALFRPSEQVPPYLRKKNKKKTQLRHRHLDSDRGTREDWRAGDQSQEGTRGHRGTNF